VGQVMEGVVQLLLLKVEEECRGLKLLDYQTAQEEDSRLVQEEEEVGNCCCKVYR